MRTRAGDLYLIEIVLDTGQRYQSVDLPGERAVGEAEDLRGRVRVVAVTLIHLETGECSVFPGRQLLASIPVMERSPAEERRALAEALGGA